MDKKEKSKYLMKNTFLFAIGNIGTKLINFLMIPLYSYCLTISEYGIIDLVFAILSIVIPIITLNIFESVQRFTMDKDADYEKIFTSSMLVTITGCLISVFCIPLVNLIFGHFALAFYTCLYIAAYSLYMCFSCFLRGKEELIKYTVCSIFLALIICGLNIYFLVILKKGKVGYFEAYALSYFLAAIIAFCAGKQWRYFNINSFDKSMMKKMSKFSIALVPNALLWWVINSSDRLMVSGMRGISENGLYAMGYKLPSLLNTFSAVFMQAWGFSAVKEFDGKSKNDFSRNVFTQFLKLMCLAAIVVLTFLKPVMNVLSEKYYDSWRYSPFLIVGFVFVSLASFAGTTYYVTKDSKRQMFSAIGGAAINIVLNFVLIPVLGANGAAIATCISYVVIFLYRVNDTKKELDLKFFRHENVCTLLLLMFAVGFVYIKNNYLSEFLLLLVFFISLINSKSTIKNIIQSVF